MSKIIFNDKLHTYSTIDGVPYKSVSSVFKNFKEAFDAEAIAKKKVLIDLFPKEYKTAKSKYGWESIEVINELERLIDKKELSERVKALKKEWADKGERSRNRGTDIHKELENREIDNGYTYSVFNGKLFKVYQNESEYDNQSIKDNLFELEDAYYPELLIFNDEHRVAGQSDGVFIHTVGDTRYVDIKDFKTDATLNILPDFKHPKNGYKKFFPPIDHINDCNLNEYSLKMSMYGYMLEEFGFKVRSLLIQKVELSDKFEILNLKPVKIPYRKEDVKNMLESLRS